jgi:hypothetical protein
MVIDKTAPAITAVADAVPLENTTDGGVAYPEPPAVTSIVCTAWSVTATDMAVDGAVTPSAYHAVGYGNESMARAKVVMRGSNAPLLK